MALAGTLFVVLVAGLSFAAGAFYGTRRGRKLEREEHQQHDVLGSAPTTKLLDEIGKREDIE